MVISCHTFYEKEDSEKVKVKIPYSCTILATTCMSTHWFIFLKPNMVALFLHMAIV